jgi:hypothetical protein
MRVACTETTTASRASTLGHRQNQEIGSMNTRVANPAKRAAVAMPSGIDSEAATRIAGLKNFKWTRAAAAVPLVLCALGGLAAAADAQPAANGAPTRSSAATASAGPGTGTANLALRQRTVAALHAQPYLDDRHINVSVEGGAVVMSGFVYSSEDLLQALRTARAHAGGAPVVDRLSIEREERR